MLDLIVFEVGTYRHLSDDDIGRKSIRWLFNAYELTKVKRYNEAIARILEMEVAVERALATAFGKAGTKLPKLPTYEEIQAEVEHKSKPPQKPAWMLKYEEVNRDRLTSRSTEEIE